MNYFGVLPKILLRDPAILAEKLSVLKFDELYRLNRPAAVALLQNSQVYAVFANLDLSGFTHCQSLACCDSYVFNSSLSPM
jgi:hypothetical protein